eukprot:410041-Pelagomonas_calceolata.AAC.2
MANQPLGLISSTSCSKLAARYTETPTATPALFSIARSLAHLSSIPLLTFQASPCSPVKQSLIHLSSSPILTCQASLRSPIKQSLAHLSSSPLQPLRVPHSLIAVLTATLTIQAPLAVAGSLLLTCKARRRKYRRATSAT